MSKCANGPARWRETVDVRVKPYPCPCCGHRVFVEPPGSYDICRICFWEDDAVQLRWPDFGGGANVPSLIEAQQNFREFGAMEPRLVKQVRPPRADEPAEAGWRPIDPDLDTFVPFATDYDEGRPWPDDLTVLYWWRPTFWGGRSWSPPSSAS